MPYASVADRQACSARNYAGKRAYFKDKLLEWRQRNPRRYGFVGQRNTAKRRGVRFNLTFEQWRDWWGADFVLRGRKRTELCMCRYGDTGPYELGNIYKATNAENRESPRSKDEGLHEDIPF